MNMRKMLSTFLAMICILSAVGFCVPAASAGSASYVYAEAYSSLQQGAYGYCTIFIDKLEDLAALNVTVYYDAEKVTMIESFNQVACSIYDYTDQPGCLQYTYILNGDGESQKTELFYFCYQIKENAPAGESYFDIVVSDTYNSSLEHVTVNGSYYNFRITESVEQRQCYLYTSSDVQTSVEQEFELNYWLSDWQIASGAMSISYDPEYFQVEEVILGNMLENKLVDVNTSLSGSIYISFVGTQYGYDSDLLTIRFRTLKNEATSTSITATVSELYNLDLQNILCAGVETTVEIGYDQAYVKDAPCMRVSAVYDPVTGQVTAVICLEEKSNLGAGDFVLLFDPEVLTLKSYKKGFSTTIFQVNDKSVADGILKFSIISLTDIQEEKTVLTIIFDANPCDVDKNVTLDLEGFMVADSLTNLITLQFVDGSVTVPANRTIGDLDFDGDVDADDLAILKAGLLPANYAGSCELSSEQKQRADINGDGEINSADRVLLARSLLDKEHPLYRPLVP